MKNIDVKLYLMWSRFKYSVLFTLAVSAMWYRIMRGELYGTTKEETISFFWDCLSVGLCN